MPTSDPIHDYEFKCGECGQHHTRKMTRDQFMDTVIRCNIGECQGECRRHIPLDGLGLDHHAMLNAQTHFSHKYPYVSNRLSLRMPGASHTDKGKVIVESARHERNLAAAGGLVRE